MCELTEYPSNAAELSFLLPYYRSTEDYTRIDGLKGSLSMLHTDVLMLLYHFAKYSQGMVLEIGSYIGGATVCMGLGALDNELNSGMVTIEPGGSYTWHPTVPTFNILDDLKKNIARYELDQLVTVLPGGSRDKPIIDAVRARAAGSGIGLLCIDADGLVDADFAAYGDLLKPGAYVVIDDYFSGHEVKTLPTKTAVDALVAAKTIECLGVYGWGTWIGRVV